MDEKIIEYTKLREVITPLDLFIFYTDSNLNSISHVGLVVTNKIYPNISKLKKNTYYVLECLIDIASKGVKCNYGFQIREIGLVLLEQKNKAGSVRWCQLKFNPWIRRVKEDNSSLKTRQKWISKCLVNLMKVVADNLYEINSFGTVFPIVPNTKPVMFITDRSQRGEKDIFQLLSRNRRHLTSILVDGRSSFRYDRPNTCPYLGLSSVTNHTFDTTVLNINQKKAFDSPRGKTSQLTFDSCMIAMIYRELGIYNVEIDPSTIKVEDFLNTEYVNCIIRLSPP